MIEGGELSSAETFAVFAAREIFLFVVQRFLVRQPVWHFLNFEETFSASTHLNFEETFFVLTNLGTF